MFGWLICKWKGHRRGRYLPTEGEMLHDVRTYECPRCLATWTRKARKPKGA